MNINEQIEKLIAYGLQMGLIDDMDRYYVINKMLAILNLDSFENVNIDEKRSIDYLEVLDNIIQYASDKNIIESVNPPYSDMLDTAIMDCMIPRPSEIIKEFNERYDNSPEKATDYFYNLSKGSHYIRTDRIKKL